MTWPIPRFDPQGVLIEDRLTGLVWSRNANPADFPLTWQEALDFVADRNREGWLDHLDWRLPNRRELRSLLSFQIRRPPLPHEHPFEGVFPSWYWTSTSVASAPSHAWYVNLDGARTFLGGEDQSFLLWPVRGQSGVLERTDQVNCYDGDGVPIPCQGTGQDGELRMGRRWPEPRLIATEAGLEDRATDLVWHLDSDAGAGPVNWTEAFAVVASLGGDWRLPNINELESLVDCGRCAPALLQGYPSGGIRQGYWSSTTSLVEPDWAWALYTENGGIGVGQKSGRHFHVWAVRDRSGERHAGAPGCTQRSRTRQDHPQPQRPLKRKTSERLFPTMSETSARYEFRAFADDFGLVEEARLRDRESLEVYIMSAGTDEYNIKIRGALMDLQAFVNYDPGLEQWSPLLKGEFPLTRQVILDKVFPAFGVAHPS